jgi:hypothetical protein
LARRSTARRALERAPQFRYNRSNADGGVATAGWLAVPLAGPFLALTERDVRRDRAMFWFPLLGGVQLAGAGMFAYGLAVPHWGLKRDAHRYGARTEIFIEPLVGPRITGAAVVGRF